MKFLFTITICLCAFLQIEAQEFAPIGTTWWYGFNEPFSPQTGFQKIESTKDTVINNLACKKLVKENVFACTRRPLAEYIHQSHDSLFFYDFDLDTFQLLVDFNAQLEDNWSIIIPSWESSLDTLELNVVELQQLNINGIMKKAVRVEILNRCDGNEFFARDWMVEDIGGLSLFMSFWPTNTDQGGCLICDGRIPTGLRCFSHPTIGDYSFPNQLPCESVTAIEEITQSDIINLTQVEHELVIQLIELNQVEMEFQLINIQGQIVSSKSLSGIESRIDVSAIPTGIYIAIISNKDGYLAQQKIFID